MGLDCSHDAWGGPFSAFTRWRHAIARAAGYQVWPVIYDDMKLRDGSGFGSDTIMLDWGHITEANLAGKWDETPADPLIVLFAHSDCDGSIYPKQARPLADALEALLPAVAEAERQQPSMGHIARGHGLVGCTERFISGLRAAAAARQALRFH